MRRMIDPKELNKGGGEQKKYYQHSIRMYNKDYKYTKSLSFVLITTDANKYTSIDEIKNILKQRTLFDANDSTKEFMIPATGTYRSNLGDRAITSIGYIDNERLGYTHLKIICYQDDTQKITQVDSKIEYITSIPYSTFTNIYDLVVEI